MLRGDAVSTNSLCGSEYKTNFTGGPVSFILIINEGI